MLLAQAWHRGRASWGTWLGMQWGWRALWRDHMGHLGTGIPITHSVRVVHSTDLTAGSTGRVGALPWGALASGFHTATSS